MPVTTSDLAEYLATRLPSSHARLISTTPKSDNTLFELHSSPTLLAATHDSRFVAQLGNGVLFCCVPGLAADGHTFAQGAVADGAAALLVERQLPLAVDQILVSNVRQAMGHAAAIVYGDPAHSMQMIGITGTNGKTTSAHMFDAVLRAAGRKSAVIGTLTQTRTTPESTELHAQLASFRAEGVTDVVMEVTSHALDLHRVAGCHYAVSIFTNLSQDHLDYHETMEKYFRAKAELFTPLYTDKAVVNIDDRYGRLLQDSAVIPTTAATLEEVTELQMRPDGSSFVWGGLHLSIGLAGDFNVRNAIGVANAARLLGIADQAIIDGLRVAVVPGRFEPVNADQPFGVIVDYAHTPDGLERVLAAARSTLASDKRLISVFGCGGDRDRGKRPLMGAIAAQRSDLAIVTSDNPRSERPDDILAEIVAGIADQPNVVVLEDRREAIRLALTTARPGDVVVLAGKGHETGQNIGGVISPFDDRVVAVEILRSLQELE